MHAHVHTQTHIHTHMSTHKYTSASMHVNARELKYQLLEAEYRTHACPPARTLNIDTSTLALESSRQSFQLRHNIARDIDRPGSLHNVLTCQKLGAQLLKGMKQ